MNFCKGLPDLVKFDELALFFSKFWIDSCQILENLNQNVEKITRSYNFVKPEKNTNTNKDKEKTLKVASRSLFTFSRLCVGAISSLLVVSISLIPFRFRRPRDLSVVFLIAYQVRRAQKKCFWCYYVLTEIGFDKAENGPPKGFLDQRLLKPR